MMTCNFSGLAILTATVDWKAGLSTAHQGTNFIWLPSFLKNSNSICPSELQ
jgi:hypothetical protein